MKSFERRVGLAAAAALLAAMASASTGAAAGTIAAFPGVAICGDASCGAENPVVTNPDGAVAAFALAAASDSQGPAPGSQLSAAGMIALGAVMMTGRVRKKSLWALRAPWRSFAGHPV